MILATTLLVRAASPYLPFPSIDDFAYLPLSFHFLDSTQYARDLFVTGFQFHLPVWAGLVWLFEVSTGLSLGFWLATLLLSLATGWVAWRLLCHFGGSGLFLPLVALTVFAGRIKGLGRGLYGGVFGDSFHMQWVAVCLLLFSYDFFLRKRPLLSGALLGLAAAAHPVVGFHGALVLAVAFLVSRGGVKNLATTGLTSILVSAPVSIPLLTHLFAQKASVTWANWDLVNKGYLFRTSHEFKLENISDAGMVSHLLLIALALSGLLLLRQLRPSIELQPFAGLLLGHVLLALATMLFHGPWLDPSTWSDFGLWPYLLHLSRTTPILVLLASLAVVAALEALFEEPRRGARGVQILRIVFIVALVPYCAIIVEWDSWLLALLVLLALTIFLVRFSWGRPVAAGLLVLASLAAAFPLSRTVLEAPVHPEQDSLYDWVRENTGQESLFIVPPGLQEFRAYARRGAYVDFKLFPASTPHLIPEWRRRLEQVSQPDKLALETDGWAAVPQWDRCYAQNNTQARIAQLLSTTAADYLVYDRDALRIPPLLELESEETPSVHQVFANTRYVVYQRGNDGPQ